MPNDGVGDGRSSAAPARCAGGEGRGGGEGITTAAVSARVWLGRKNQRPRGVAEKSLLAHTLAMKRWQEEVSAHRIAACAAEEEYARVTGAEARFRQISLKAVLLSDHRCGHLVTVHCDTLRPSHVT